MTIRKNRWNIVLTAEVGTLWLSHGLAWLVIFINLRDTQLVGITLLDMSVRVMTLQEVSIWICRQKKEDVSPSTLVGDIESVEGPDMLGRVNSQSFLELGQLSSLALRPQSSNFSGLWIALNDITGITGPTVYSYPTAGIPSLCCHMNHFLQNSSYTSVSHWFCFCGQL